MTMKGISERAGVGRQTVYRWWTTKAEILMEAMTIDAAEALQVDPAEGAPSALLGFLTQWRSFLCDGPSGLAYRALIGEAQHDAAVRELIQNADLLGTASRRLLDSIATELPGLPSLDLAGDQLTGPLLIRVLTRPSPPMTTSFPSTSTRYCAPGRKDDATLSINCETRRLVLG